MPTLSLVKRAWWQKMVTEKARIIHALPDVDGRSRLALALKAALEGGQLSAARSLDELLQRLSSGGEFEYVFVSTEFGIPAIQQFLGRFAALSKRTTPLVVATLPPGDQDPSIVADLYTRGVGGFICAPFSAEQIRQVLELIGAEIPEGANQTAQVARFLMRDAMRSLDAVAQNRLNGDLRPGFVGRNLKAVSRTLKAVATEISEESLADLLLKEFSEARPFAERSASAKARSRRVVKHPGVVIGELIASRKLSPDEVKARLTTSADQLDALLNQRAELTEDLARELARIFGKTAKFYVGLQRDYSEYKKQFPDPPLG